ncbi:hypothetical protein CcaverHIS002_0501570 [Cutaneotrichosporon cavernicola]|uniref:Methionine aminopeptidase n=1 Tax=Cutaneotrichosporon cavernicola TaxID=279322 RepID=A0AA48L5Y2_9TREE|nr:uncharacterized protein CcaverHIS019_0502170 [Cutaneotrichosporon cavernicola]BEI84756.1 hypothetical protein CcaverHIS002_0501570 [Cutaneotrichosporon cavernicola]BEI92589.1 hypothetical protein CcaverHIS019_0502170 [Cutaneotrichosporon cavernicola]BEJ00364.1 hypothetical protein CcaverHIS631_0502210 [Cutaneotrichosporon cavernicola]BEJ08134.1 hypothetical protein CcaverHIS641_0502190 [Cutaneotrichosporon cavernicola]
MTWATSAARCFSRRSRLARLTRCFSSPSKTEWEHNTPSPSQFGTYAVLSSKSAMEVYPPPRPVPESIPRPAYVPANFFTAPIWEHLPGGEEVGNEGITLGSREEDGVRAAARMAGEVLRAVGQIVEPGMTTDDIDAVVHEMAVKRGAYPSPLGYSHFPRSCTTSVNNIIAHGIPDSRPLLATDIVNVDITLYYNGFHGDTSATFVLPAADAAGRELVRVTREALELGISVCGPGKSYAGIGKVIEEHARKHGMSVNTQFVGHGIGRKFHAYPHILHHKNHERGLMKSGDCFTIEPPLVQGTRPRGGVWDDGWTVATDTGARSAQFEHQILITETGADVLTRVD